MNATLLIIDAMNLIRRIYAIQEKQHGETEKALIGTQTTACNAVKKLLNLHQPTHVIAVFDNHAESWRHQIYPQYKQGRKPIPAPLKAGLAQFLALEFTELNKSKDRDSRSIVKYLPWLSNLPTNHQQG